jgi:hypothetical protein
LKTSLTSYSRLALILACALSGLVPLRAAPSSSVTSADSLFITTASESTHKLTVTERLEAADRFRNIYTDQPASDSAREAKGQEALALLQAAWLGDTTQDIRRRQAVAAVRADKTIPVSLRYHVAATAENQPIRRLSLPLAERLVAYERVARQLVAEFPDLPEAYEPLAHLAEDMPDDQRAQALARDVLHSPAHPVAKAHAQALLDRHALVGGPLVALLDQALLKRTAGHPTVIYSWSLYSLRSLRLAQELQKQASANAVLLGVNLDKDTAKAQSTALAEKLPGEQFYDAEGPTGDLAVRLKFTAPGLAYAIDRQGVVRSVTLAHDAAGKLAALRTP